MSKEVEILIKLRSVPALVVATTRSFSATDVLLQLIERGFRAKKMGPSTVVVEEK